jgi:hypothetical protein
LPADAPLFNVPRGLRLVLDRDLKAAGIPKKDERGWTADVHALRHTFGTLLSKCGVTPRTAQAAMRHSSIDLTMNLYTDPRLLDVAGALDALPDLPLTGGLEGERIAAQATGTSGHRRLGRNSVAPAVAPGRCNAGQSLSLADTVGRAGERSENDGALPQSHLLSTKEAGCHGVTAGLVSRAERIRTSDLLNPIQCRLRGRWVVRTILRGPHDDRLGSILRPNSKVSRQLLRVFGPRPARSLPRDG